MATSRSKSPTGLAFERHFTKALAPDACPSSLFTWTQRHVEVKDGDALIFSGEVEAPDFWSDLAVLVAAKTWFRKYVHKGETEPRREDSIKQMFLREADAIAEASRYPDVGTDYFGGDESRRRAFRDEIFYIQTSQNAMFNTPVHVNVGVVTPKHDHCRMKNKASGTWGAYNALPPNRGPQSSACFIQSVEDTMESLCALQTSETQLFRRGSGTGSNLSALRPAGTPLSHGGTASGPVSFMRGLDAWAGVTKSGGSSRRAALMRVLDVYHPDVRDFIGVKATAQKMIRDLTAQGWSKDFNGVATTWTPYQNANNSVRVDDAFMTAATTGGKTWLHWPTKWDGAVWDTDIAHRGIDASSLLDDIAKAAHDCGDPGVQFDTAMNKWHTTPLTARINATNPCSEFAYMDNTSCNLASLRLTKFLRSDGSFDVAAFSYVARAMFIAQEILVGASSYPTQQIAKNSHDFRPLGLGYCDLGAMLMQLGQAYDSDEGRSVCAAVTSLLGGVAYRTSGQIAMCCGGPFAGWKLNKASMMQVIGMHVAAAEAIVDRATKPLRLFADVAHVGHTAWQQAETLGEQHGFRNAQATVLAPTGTIGFAMDCDTTGIEPDTALVKRKKLAGGGTLEYVNQSVAPALRRLGYNGIETSLITEAIKKTGRLPEFLEACGAHVLPGHRSVFATAFGQPDNEVSVDGHLKMMAAAQPFLSGAISKTVNCPNHYTVADVREVFVKAWKLGLKAVAVYRDGSKDQPLEAKTKEAPVATVPTTAPETAKEDCPNPSTVNGTLPTGYLRWVGDPALTAPSTRRRLPVDAPAHRHKFTLGGIDGYVHLGFYPDTNTVGEIFVRMEPKAKGQVAVDLATQAASVAIQHGADVTAFLDRWEGTEFAPSGFTGEGEQGVAWASSPLDYLAKWLRRFLATRAAEAQTAPQSIAAAAPMPQPSPTPPQPHSASQTRSERCPRCTTQMRQDGACRSCPACGYGQGGCGT